MPAEISRWGERQVARTRRGARASRPEKLYHRYGYVLKFIEANKS